MDPNYATIANTIASVLLLISRIFISLYATYYIHPFSVYCTALQVENSVHRKNLYKIL